MFKLLRPGSFPERLPLKKFPQLVRQDGTFKVQRLRFKRPISRYVPYLFLIGASLFIWLPTITIDKTQLEASREDAKKIEEKKIERLNKIQNPEQKAMALSLYSGIQNKTIFVPLEVWPRKRPDRFYTASSPEWQSFASFSQDMKRQEEVKGELAGICHGYATQHPWFQQTLGDSIILNAHCLKYQYSQALPPEYERSGLKIGFNQVEWTTRPVTDRNRKRLDRVLIPDAIGWSYWNAGSLFLSQMMAKAKAQLKLQSKDKEKKQSHLPNIQESQLARHQTNERAHHTGLAGKQLSSAKPANSTTSKESATTTSELPPMPDESVTVPLPLLPVSVLSSKMESTTKEFQKTLVKTWRKATAPELNGTILVKGHVMIEGPQAMCEIVVHAFYHPQDCEWKYIGYRLQDLQPRSLAPLGGP